MKTRLLTLLMTGILVGALLGASPASAVTVRIANLDQWEMERYLTRGPNLFTEQDDTYPGLAAALDQGVSKGIVWWWSQKISPSSLIATRYSAPAEQVARAFIGADKVMVASAGSTRISGLGRNVSTIQQVTLPELPRGWTSIDLPERTTVFQVENRQPIGGSWRVASLAIRDANGVLQRVPLSTAPGSSAYVVSAKRFRAMVQRGKGEEWVQTHLGRTRGFSFLILRPSTTGFDEDASAIRDPDALQLDTVLVYVDPSAVQQQNGVVIGWEQKPFILRGAEGEREANN